MSYRDTIMTDYIQPAQASAAGPAVRPDGDETLRTLKNIDFLLTQIRDRDPQHTGRCTRWAWRFNKNLKDWGPLVWTIIGTAAAICFGIFSIFAFNEAKVANKIAFAALLAARDGNSLATQAYSQGYYMYELARAQIILDQIDNCRDLYPDLLRDACSTISAWASDYAITVASFYRPTPMPTISATPGPTPTPPVQTSLSDFYAAARQETRNTISEPESAVLVFVPAIVGVAAVLFFGIAGMHIFL